MHTKSSGKVVEKVECAMQDLEKVRYGSPK